MKGQMAVGGHRAILEGPAKPTFIERFAGLLPLPYPLAGMVWTLLLGPPSIVLVNLLYTGDLTESLKRFFATVAPQTVWQQALAVAFWSFLCWYGFWMVRYIRTRLETAEDHIAPLLPGGKATYRRAFRLVSHPLWAVLIGILLGAAFLPTALITYRYALGPLVVAWHSLYLSFFYLISGVASWVYISALWGLRKLGRQGLRLDPYHADNMMGLRAIGSLSLAISSAFFGFLGITTIQMLLGPVVVEYLLSLGVMLVLGVVLFFLPLRSFHWTMAREKSRLRTDLSKRLARAVRAMDDERPGADLVDGVSELRSIMTLGLAERKLESLAVWPFDTRILGKLSAVVLSVIAGLVVNILVKWVLRL